MEKKLDGNCKRMLWAVLNKSWGTSSHKTAAVWTPTTHLEKSSKLDEQDIWDTVGEERTNEQTHKWCTPMEPFTQVSKGWATS